jgi:hypothetical protein
MMAMPIWDKIVMEKLLLKTSGTTASNKAKLDQMIHRLMLWGLK